MFSQLCKHCDGSGGCPCLYSTEIKMTNYQRLTLSWIVQMCDVEVQAIAVHLWAMCSEWKIHILVMIIINSNWVAKAQDFWKFVMEKNRNKKLFLHSDTGYRVSMNRSIM